MDTNGALLQMITLPTTFGAFVPNTVMFKCSFTYGNLIQQRTFAYIVVVRGCGDFWDSGPFSKYCYQFNFQSSLTWVQARDACRQQKADLLSITTTKEQGWIAGKDIFVADETYFYDSVLQEKHR